jgi:RNA polymerase sigma-70 factor (ECF subfamily)
VTWEGGVKRQDKELVRRALHGDKDAFGELVRKYQSAVYGLCFHLVGDFTDAQDLAQEAFLRAYLDLYQLREPSKFAGWLYRLTENICKMWLRKRKPETVPLDMVNPDDLISSSPSPQEEMEKEELKFIVRRAINSLSEKSRLVLTLYYIDGLSYKEIGDFLGVPVSTVKTRLHRARLKLKGRLMRMVEKTFEEHELPEDFTEKVLREVSVVGIKGGSAREEGEKEEALRPSVHIVLIKKEEELEEAVKRAPKPQLPVLLLADKTEGEKVLPIWIGFPEALAISSKLEGKEFTRPMTHDLMANILREFGMKLTKVVIGELRENIFFAKLVIEMDGVMKEIDARPSDAVALALRLNAPIFVAEDLFRTSGCSPEEVQ